MMLRQNHVLVFGFSLLALTACATSATSAPATTQDTVIHVAPKTPTLIASDLLPAFKNAVAPPPAAGSDGQKADEKELFDRQAKRTDDDCKRANSEVHVTLGDFFGKPFGTLTEAEVEHLAPLFAQVRNDADFYIQLLKKEFPRKRPFLYLKEITPCVPKEVTGAYPSGHATLSRLYARILSDLYPEQKTAFLDRAEVIATDRVMVGMHHTTDIRAGQQLGDLLYKKLRDSKAFRARFTEAKFK